MQENTADKGLTTTEVVVVGAGPVGLTAALTLAEAGVQVTVVEKASAPGDLPRAISLQDESFRILEQIGLAEPLKIESLTDTGSRYFGLDEQLLAEAKPMPSRLGHPAKSQFDQPILEQLLFDRAMAHPKIEMRLSAEVVELTQDVDAAYIKVQVAGRQETLAAKWLIGADGGKSFVRRALGIELEGTTQPERWLVVDIRNEPIQRDPYAEFHCDGQRPYVLVPGIKGRLRLEFMLFDGEDAEYMASPEKVRELMRPFRAELPEEDIRRAAVYVAHQRVAESYRSGRCFLAGDAAHLMPPFAGQGLNAGLRDASNLAWKLWEVLRGGAGDQLLDTYELERKVHGTKMMKLSRRIGAVVMATNPVATRLRDAAVRGLKTLPTVHNYLARMKFVTPPDYTDGLTVSTGSEPQLVGAPVGKALSQPEVRDVDGTVSGLDAYLPYGWSLIGVQADPAQVDPYFESLVAARLRIEPPHQVTVPGSRAGVASLVELEQCFTGQHHGPLFVLVRPDRYVAAVFTPAEQEAVVDKLRGFIDDRIRTAGSIAA